MGRTRRKRSRRARASQSQTPPRPQKLSAWLKGAIGAVTIVGTVLGAVVSAQQLMGDSTGDAEGADVAGSTAAPPLELRGDGLGDVNFGDDLDDAISEVAGVLGSASNDGETECESGSDTLVFWDDLYIVGDDGAFVGWSYGPPLASLPEAPLQSELGVTIGMPLAELYALFRNDVVVTGRTTLSDEIAGAPTVEFYIDQALGKAENGMSGFLTGNDRGDVVTGLSGGDDCAFR